MTSIVVLGGGPAGYVAALRAAELGASVTLVESLELGGTCLNRGCIPTKAMVAAVERLRSARGAAEFGIVLGEPRVDVAALLARRAAVVAQQRAGVEHLLSARKVEIVAGFGRLLDGRTVGVSDEPDGAAGREVRGDAVILATGSRPALPPVFAVDDPRIVTSDELLALDGLPESLAIVGGGVIGCEFAAIYAELGVPTTIVEMLDRLLPAEDRRASAALSRAFQMAGVQSKVRTRVERLELPPTGPVGLVLSDGATVEAAVVLVSVGRAPLSRGLGFAEAGVELDGAGFVVTDAGQRTSLDGVFAAGDLAGPPLLAHWAYHQGATAAENAVLGGGLEVDRRFVPNCIFSFPEVASFGTSEDEAKAQNLPVKVAQVRFNANSKAVIEGENDGYIRIVARADDERVIGASLVGPHVTELVHELVLAAQAGLTLGDVAATIHAHPTLAEGVGEAVLCALGRGMHTL
jgi:dihydrolipoamide dehydrogenase